MRPTNKEIDFGYVSRQTEANISTSFVIHSLIKWEFIHPTMCPMQETGLDSSARVMNQSDTVLALNRIFSYLQSQMLYSPSR